MRGVYVAIALLAVVTAGLCGFQGLCHGQDPGIGAGVQGPDGDGGPSVEAKPRIRLYVLPQPKPQPEPPPVPTPKPEPKPEPPTPPAPVVEYPELAAADGLFIIFGADWCEWCKRQAEALKEQSKYYNVLYVNIDEPRWGALKKAWGFEKSAIPVTALVVEGQPVSYWVGYTGWNSLYPHSKKAKKTNEQRKADFIIKPLK